MLRLALFTLGTSSLAVAIDTVTVPDTVTAGDEFSVDVISNLRFDPGSGQYVGAQWEHYQLFLADSENPYNEVWPMCYLSDAIPFSQTSADITVPKEAAPPGDTYHIYAIAFNGSHFSNQANESQSSSAFELEDTDVESYSPQEWAAPKSVYGSVPCSAQQCNRQCKESFFATSTAANSNDGYCSCLAECPGVSTENPNPKDGCSQAWKNGAATTTQGSSSSVTGTPRATGANTTPAPAATSNQDSSTTPSTGGVAQMLPTGQAYAALAMLAFL